MICFDSDDFGCDHIISDMCQSHDCRDQLDKFHIANPNFKATLFAIPMEMTPEILLWCKENEGWIELAVHGIFHSSNYECEKMDYQTFDVLMSSIVATHGALYSRGFKAPGWQISDDCYRWLNDNGWWVADQAYNDERRPKDLPAYVNSNGEFRVYRNGTPSDIIPASHHHTWDCMGNGVYEQEEYILDLIKDETEFKFVSEVINEAYIDKDRTHDNG